MPKEVAEPAEAQHPGQFVSQFGTTIGQVGKKQYLCIVISSETASLTKVSTRVRDFTCDEER